MKIGVPKEVKNLENRVSIVKAGVKALIRQGHEVVIQSGAGVGSGIEDHVYQECGATIVSSAKEAWDADLVLKVKEPQPEEFSLMREGQYLFTYLHLANELELTKALMEKKVRAIAYETIQLPDNSLPLLRPMSEVAGRMAPQVGAHFLEKTQKGRGVLLGGVPGVPRGVVTVIGGGVAGTNAAKIAVGLGARVNIIEVGQKRLEYLDDVFGSTINPLMSNDTNIEESVLRSDVVIGSVLIPGAKAPKLVTTELMKKMKPGSVLVDIAIDQGGCFESSRPTSHQNPIFVENGVIHYCVTNMPGAVARSSTLALTNHTLRYLLKICQDPVGAMKNDPTLKFGANCWDGHCVYKQVADDLGLDYQSLDQLL